MKIDNDDDDDDDDDEGVSLEEDDVYMREAATARVSRVASVHDEIGNAGASTEGQPTGGWTLCETWEARPLGFVLGDALGQSGDADACEEMGAQPSLFAEHPHIYDDTNNNDKSYNAQWRPISSTTEAEDLVIGIL